VNRYSKLRAINLTINAGIILDAPLMVISFFHCYYRVGSNVFDIFSQIDIVAYKKFRTEYRPFMMKLQLEYCHEIAERSHPYFKLYDGILDEGTLFDPCPLKVIKSLVSQNMS